MILGIVAEKRKERQSIVGVNETGILEVFINITYCCQIGECKCKVKQCHAIAGSSLRVIELKK